ncbi:hypothetical protein ABT403_16250 [Streptomyces sp. NPDC000075]
MSRSGLLVVRAGARVRDRSVSGLPVARAGARERDRSGEVRA